MEAALSEWMISSISLGIKRIFTSIILGAVVRIREDFLGSCNVHELLLSRLLLLFILEFVRMPLKCEFLVSLLYLLLGGTPLNSKNFIIISFSCLFLQFLSFGHTLLGSGEAFIFF